MRVITLKLECRECSVEIDADEIFVALEKQALGMKGFCSICCEEITAFYGLNDLLFLCAAKGKSNGKGDGV